MNAYPNTRLVLKDWYPAFKATLADGGQKHSDEKFEVGKTYSITNGKPISVCENGYHACLDLASVNNYYRWIDEMIRGTNKYRLFKVSLKGECAFEYDKIAAEHIRFDEEIDLNGKLRVPLNGDGTNFVNFENGKLTNNSDGVAARVTYNDSRYDYVYSVNHKGEYVIEESRDGRKYITTCYHHGNNNVPYRFGYHFESEIENRLKEYLVEEPRAYPKTSDAYGVHGYTNPPIVSYITNARPLPYPHASPYAPYYDIPE